MSKVTYRNTEIKLCVPGKRSEYIGFKLTIKFSTNVSTGNTLLAVKFRDMSIRRISSFAPSHFQSYSRLPPLPELHDRQTRIALSGILRSFISNQEIHPVMAVSTYTIKQFGVMSVGKFCAVFGLVWGFFMGLMLAVGVGGIASVMGTPAVGIGAGIFAFVIVIVAGGVLGFIGGAIVAVVYNIVLGATGGIEMDLEVKA